MRTDRLALVVETPSTTRERHRNETTRHRISSHLILVRLAGNRTHEYERNPSRTGVEVPTTCLTRWKRGTP